MSSNANTIRTSRGLRAIAGHPDYRSGGLDFYSAATDTIADILHALAHEDQLRARREPFDADRYLDRARVTFEGDREDDDNATPATPYVKRTYRAEELDQLASLARTALDDPFSLPSDGPHAYNEDGLMAYAVARLDELIQTLNPHENTPETMARALRTLGRHMAEILDRLDAGPAAWNFDEAAAAVDRGLDDVDEAIRTLEGDTDQ